MLLYVIGITDINELSKNRFYIKTYGENYGISFSDDKIRWCFNEYIHNL